MSLEDEDQLTSHWRLPPRGVRQITPARMVSRMQTHPLADGLHVLAMGYYPKALRHRMRRVDHDSYLLMYCVGGAGYAEVEGRESPVGVGDILLLPPGVAHSYGADAKNPWTIFWVHFAGHRAVDFAEFMRLSTGVNKLGLQARLMSGFEELLNIRRQALTLNGFVQAANQLRLLLTQIGTIAAQRRQNPQTDLGMGQVTEYMQRHLSQELDLDALAELANLSKFYFIRRFKERTGHTPIQHFIHLKMERACELLDSTDASIKAVASDLGFADPLYFSRQFRKVIGVAPQKYRAMHAT